MDTTGWIVIVCVVSSLMFMLGAAWNSRTINDLYDDLREAKHYRDKYMRERDYLHDKFVPKRNKTGQFTKKGGV